VLSNLRLALSEQPDLGLEPTSLRGTRRPPPESGSQERLGALHPGLVDDVLLAGVDSPLHAAFAAGDAAVAAQVVEVVEP
jgi:hypothetical protein